VLKGWNNTSRFIFDGKAGELDTNRRAKQEISLLCLHPLQASLVYINSLMIQEVFWDPGWLERMTNRDLAALSPLLTQHINPYGRFELNMETRIALASW
jgi:TnpA family transposase